MELDAGGVASPSMEVEPLVDNTPKPKPRGRNQKPQSLIHSGPMGKAEYKAYTKAQDSARKRAKKRRDQQEGAAKRIAHGEKRVLLMSGKVATTEVQQVRLQHMFLPNKESWCVVIPLHGYRRCAI